MERIVVFVKDLASGGAEKQAALLAKIMSCRYESHIIIFNGLKKNGGRETDAKNLAILNQGSINVHYLDGDFISRFRQLVKLLKTLQPVAVFSYLTGANAIAAVAGKIAKVKVVSGLRNAYLSTPKLFADRIITNHLSAATISNSYAGKDVFVSKGFRSDKISVVTNVFDNISADTPQRNASNDIVKIISVGRFVPDKDYDTAIKAVATAHKLNSAIRYEIVGYGILEAEIREAVKEAGIEDITTIAINPTDIPQRLLNADIYLSTSINEGTSNAVMEALNAELPVIATNVGDNARLVENGINGYITDVKAIDDISRHIIRLAGDATLRTEMGHRGKELLRRHHSPEAFLGAYTSFINKLDTK